MGPGGRGGGWGLGVVMGAGGGRVGKGGRGVTGGAAATGMGRRIGGGAGENGVREMGRCVRRMGAEKMGVALDGGKWFRND